MSGSMEMDFMETSTSSSSLMLPTQSPIWHPSEEVTEFDETVLNAEQWDLLELYRLNRSIHQPWFSIYSWAYISVITLTFVSNTLFFCSMIRRRDSWTPRNVFILNLAVADLCICFTMSFSATDVLTKYWPFGVQSVYLCRCIKASPCFLVYFMSMIIVVIALDRFRCIVQPSSVQLTTRQAALIIPAIGALALTMSTPVFLHTHIHIPRLPNTSSANSAQSNGSTTTIQGENKRHMYSIFSLVFQFILPFSVISCSYYLIYRYLQKNRLIRKDKIRDREKARRTNAMLFRVSMVFCICWLPLNVLVLVIDGTDLFKDNHELMLCAFMSCHLIGMSSACFNPMLYGYCFETERSLLNRLLGKCAIHVPCLSHPAIEENDHDIEFQTRSRHIGGVD
eukprot:TCALIF_06430-PA protein Name:"Similar to NPFR Neuropeptide F receptor (Drosophila melanogaster)" AED:0.14 eAED:0.17 QI:0/0.4/0.33/0.83/1/1/6/0/394